LREICGLPGVDCWEDEDEDEDEEGEEGALADAAAAATWARRVGRADMCGRGARVKVLGKVSR
jgi:hypothetical protein